MADDGLSFGGNILSRGGDELENYFVRILAFSRKKHHFHDFLRFFSHFFRFLQREFLDEGYPLWGGISGELGGKWG